MSDKKPHIKPLDSVRTVPKDDSYMRLRQIPYKERLTFINKLEKSLNAPGSPKGPKSLEDVLTKLKASCPPIRPIDEEDYEK